MVHPLRRKVARVRLTHTRAHDHKPNRTHHSIWRLVYLASAKSYKSSLVPLNNNQNQTVKNQHETPTKASSPRDRRMTLQEKLHIPFHSCRCGQYSFFWIHPCWYQSLSWACKSFGWVSELCGRCTRNVTFFMLSFLVRFLWLWMAGSSNDKKRKFWTSRQAVFRCSFWQSCSFFKNFRDVLKHRFVWFMFDVNCRGLRIHPVSNKASAVWPFVAISTNESYVSLVQVSVRSRTQASDKSKPGHIDKFR